MATHNITINEQGTPTPKPMAVIQREDIVSFFAGNKPIILCLPVTVFGTESRIKIAAGDSIAVRVKPNAPHGDFTYWTCILDNTTVDLTCDDLITRSGELKADGKGDSDSGSVGMLV